MKSIHRAVSVFAVCSLSLACTEPEPARAPKQPMAKESRLKRMPGDSHDFTATAPAQPRSIVDAPKPVAPPAGEPVPAEVSKPELKTEAKPELVDKEELTQGGLELAPADVHIDRFVLATGVEQREPIGESESFGTDTDKIFAFVQFENEKGAPFALRVHWEKVGGPASPYGYVMEVPTAKRWRTWSWTAIKRAPGRYRAVLRTLAGEEVASREFVIEAPEPQGELPLE